jgi:hypothetical protein
MQENFKIGISSGMIRVKVYNEKGMPEKKGVGKTQYG